MEISMTQSTAFPMAKITLKKGESLMLERGAMVYQDGPISLEGKMNANSSGLGGALKALGRAVTSGESFFITKATSQAEGAVIAIAPPVPGMIKELKVGTTQWYINDGAFLACETSVNYEIQRQSLGRAIFAGTGGLFIMQTKGQGSMLINSFGDIVEMELDGSKPLTVDNTHVLAWTSGLTYHLRVASGTFGFKTGEGLVNEFQGKGKVLIQTRNIASLAGALDPFITKGG